MTNSVLPELIPTTAQVKADTAAQAALALTAILIWAIFSPHSSAAVREASADSAQEIQTLRERAAIFRHQLQSALRKPQKAVKRLLTYQELRTAHSATAQVQNRVPISKPAPNVRAKVM